MPNYLCDDGGAPGSPIEITASAGRAAAEEYVLDGDWGDHPCTIWVTVHVERYHAGGVDGRHLGPRNRYTVAIDPPAPACVDADHDWQSPDWLGGCKENPGVWGHGGGVKIKEVCGGCGTYRHTDTWAQDPCTGEQGLDSVAYEGADKRSQAWIEEETR